MTNKILAVFAHPNDESFGTGGTLAYYAHNGIEVHLVCGTRGEVGEVDPALLKKGQTIGELREHELRCAAGILGLASVRFLGYRDSGMAGSQENNHQEAFSAQPLEKVARQIVDIIRELKPEVVLTFDPNGGYKHPDHIMVHRAAVEAFDRAADPNYQDGLPPFQPQRLFYATFPNRFMKILVKLLKFFGGDPEHWGKNKDINLVEIVKDTFPVNVKINYRSVIKERDAAAACHASQGGGGLNRGILGWWRNTFSPFETFMQARPPKTDKKISRDFFDGLPW